MLEINTLSAVSEAGETYNYSSVTISTFYRTYDGNASSITTNFTTNIISNITTNYYNNVPVVKTIIAFIVTMFINCNNVVNLVILRRMKTINRKVKALMVSMSVSDLLLGMFVGIPAVTSALLHHWPFTPALCQVTGIINGVSINVSIWSLTGISVERFLAVVRPAHFNQQPRLLHVRIAVGFIWVFNVMYYAIPVFERANAVYYLYSPDTLVCGFYWDPDWYLYLGAALFPVGSTTVIVFCSYKIIQITRQVITRDANDPSTSAEAGGVRHEEDTPARRKSRSNSDVSPASTDTGSRWAEASQRIISSTELNLRGSSSYTSLRSGSNNDEADRQVQVSNFAPRSSSSAHLQVPTAVYKEGQRQRSRNGVAAPGDNVLRSGRPVSFIEDQTQTQRISVEDADDQIQSLRSSIRLPEKQNQSHLSSGRRVTMSATQLAKAKRVGKVTKVTIMTTLAVVTLCFPYLATVVYETSLNAEISTYHAFLVMWCLNCNSFVNVFIYSATYGEFRQLFKQIFLRSSVADPRH